MPGFAEHGNEDLADVTGVTGNENSHGEMDQKQILEAWNASA